MKPDIPAYIVGAYEHPTRFAPDKSIAQLHAECARGALADAGLTFADVDGYFCGADAPSGIPLQPSKWRGSRWRPHTTPNTIPTLY